jgi:hypothetical protein
VFHFVNGNHLAQFPSPASFCQHVFELEQKLVAPVLRKVFVYD